MRPTYMNGKKEFGLDLSTDLGTLARVTISTFSMLLFARSAFSRDPSEVVVGPKN